MGHVRSRDVTPPTSGTVCHLQAETCTCYVQPRY